MKLVKSWRGSFFKRLTRHCKNFLISPIWGVYAILEIQCFTDSVHSGLNRHFNGC